MDGGRDTELAMGMYQPSYLAHNSPEHTARGQVCTLLILPISHNPHTLESKTLKKQMILLLVLIA